MKRYLSLLIAIVMVMGLMTACGGNGGETEPLSGDAANKVAMITDYSDITDQSFNQTCYEGC